MGRQIPKTNDKSNTKQTRTDIESHTLILKKKKIRQKTKNLKSGTTKEESNQTNKQTHK